MVVTWSPGTRKSYISISKISKKSKKNPKFIFFVIFKKIFDYYLLHSGRYDPNLVRKSPFVTFSSHLDFEETKFHICCVTSKPLGNGYSIPISTIYILMPLIIATYNFDNYVDNMGSVKIWKQLYWNPKKLTLYLLLCTICNKFIIFLSVYMNMVMQKTW